MTDDTPEDRALRDMLACGTGIMQDGERIDPKDFFAEPKVDTRSEAVERLALAYDRRHAGRNLEADMLRTLAAERDTWELECLGARAARDVALARAEAAEAERDAAKQEADAAMRDFEVARDALGVIAAERDALVRVARAAKRWLYDDRAGFGYEMCISKAQTRNALDALPPGVLDQSD